MARASASLVISYVVSAGAYFGFVLLVARLAGPQDRGVVAFVTTLPLLLGYSSTLGLEIANLYLAGSRPELRPALTSTSVVVGMVSGSLFAALAWAALSLQPQWVPDATPDAVLALALGSTGLITTQVALDTALIGSGAVRAANLVRVAIPVLSVIVYASAYLVTNEAGAAVATWAWVAGRIVGFVLVVAFAAAAIGIAPPRRTMVAARASLRYGLPAHVGTLASMPIRRFDTLVLGASRGATELGIYTVAVNAAEVFMYLPTAVSMVLLPATAGRSSDEIRAMVRRTALVVVGLTILGAAVAALLAPAIVRIVFGQEFVGAVTPLRIMMVALVGMSVRILANTGLQGGGRQALASGMTVVTLVVVVALDLALIPRFGAEGAASASAIAYWVGALLLYGAFVRVLPAVTKARPSEEIRAAWGLIVELVRTRGTGR